MDVSTTKIIDAARELLKEYGYFMEGLWHVDDIHFICEQKNLRRLSKDEAMEVFTIAYDQFDGELGISWPQLENALDIFLKRERILEQKEVQGAER